jgi:hypothetical protein
LTVAEVNGAKLVIPPKAGQSIIVVDGWFNATGSAGTATSIDVAEASSTGTVAVAVAAGNLTNGTHAPFTASSGVTWTTFGVALDEGKGVAITKTKGGSDVSTTTQLDYCIKYLTVPT